MPSACWPLTAQRKSDRCYLGWHSVKLVELELGERRANDNDSVGAGVGSGVGAGSGVGDGSGVGALNCIMLTNER